MKETGILMSGPMARAIDKDEKTVTRRIVKNIGNWAITPQNDGSAFTSMPCPFGQPGDRLWVRETWADVNGENGPMITYRAGGNDRFLTDISYPVDYSLFPGGKFTMWCSDLWNGEDGHSWRPSLFMPRWASRFTLEIVSIRIERVASISEAEAKAEGVSNQIPVSIRHPFKHKKSLCTGLMEVSYIETYEHLWNLLNAKPKPIYVGKEIVHYVSYPFKGEAETKTYRGKPWYVKPNPWAWCIEFKKVQV